MSQSEPPLGTFVIDIVAPASMESRFRCFTELAERAFTLAEQQAGPDPTSVPLSNCYASILYPVGNTDAEPFPIKAVLYQYTPAMEVRHAVINFQTKTAEREGQPNLPIEPEQIDHAQKEIKSYIQDVWRRKRARQIQKDMTWKDFLERLQAQGIYVHNPSEEFDSPHALRRCPLCGKLTVPCTSCHVIMCVNQDCAASRLVPFQSCFHHGATAACLPCLDNAKSIPALGQCPDCHLWFCQSELTWCLGRPKDGLHRPSWIYLRQPHNSTREHPTKPIGCSSCTGGESRPHCSNGKCWSHVGDYTSVCTSCSPNGGLWCTCEQCWICDNCASSPTENCFKACLRCERTFCMHSCKYIDFCTECGRTTLCADCVEEDWSAFAPDAAEGVVLKGGCQWGHCFERICGACLEGTRCAVCKKTFCSSCMWWQWCGGCGRRFCSECYRTPKRTSANRCSSWETFAGLYSDYNEVPGTCGECDANVS